MKRRQLNQALLALPGLLASPLGHAADFPSKPIRVILPLAAGNIVDIALRILNEEFSVSAGQQLVIESKPGASGIIAAQSVANSAPDGYSLLAANTGLYAINPHTFKKLPYDPETSFKPVTNFLGASLVMGAMVGRSSSEPAYGPSSDLPSRAGSSELFTQVTADNGLPLTVTVVDPRQRVMAVYHVDRATGEISPKSVRNITWDLQMVEYNSGKPLPQDIRNGLKR